MTDTRTVHLMILALIVLVVTLYSNTLDNDFVWDDGELIVQNYPLHHARYLPSLLTRSFFDRPAGELDPCDYPYWRPLTLLSLALDYRIWGADPFGYHLTNIALHVLNCVLVLTLWSALFPPFAVAAGAALIFAVHPLQTNAVAYISGRTDLIATAFLLLASLCCLRYMRAAGRGALAGMLLCVWLSLMAKESALAAPLFFLCLGALDRAMPRRTVSAACLSLLPIAVYIICRSLFHLSVASWGSALRSISPSTICAAAEGILVYARLLVFPVGLHMERFLDIPSPQGARAFFSMVLVITVICVALGSVVRGRGRDGARRPVFSLLFFAGLALFLPVSNILPLYPAFARTQLYLGEQFLYLPLVHEALRLLGIVARQNPSSALVHLNMGNVYHLKGALDSARGELNLARRLNPSSATILDALGLLDQSEGRTDNAILLHREAVALDPRHIGARINLALAYMKRSSPADAEHTLQDWVIHQTNKRAIMTA
ncbi:MAG: hypothetical protein NT045_01790 [Candidatus Aureabacteria bacterium]|nr:hypothetical protein [Candidatus Auribacterota bacterium]